MTAPQPASPERIVALLASMSWVAAMPPRERSALLAKVAALIGDGSTPPELPIQFVIGLARLKTRLDS